MSFLSLFPPVTFSPARSVKALMVLVLLLLGDSLSPMDVSIGYLKLLRSGLSIPSFTASEMQDSSSISHLSVSHRTAPPDLPPKPPDLPVFLCSGASLLKHMLPHPPPATLRSICLSSTSVEYLLGHATPPVTVSTGTAEILRSDLSLLFFNLPEQPVFAEPFSPRVSTLTEPPDSRLCSQPLFCPPSCTPDSDFHPLRSTFTPPSPSLATAVSQDLLLFIVEAWPIKPCLGWLSYTVLESSIKPSPEVVNFVSFLSNSPYKRPTEINGLLLSPWIPPPFHSLHRLVPSFVRILELSLASAPATYQKIKLLLWLPSASFSGHVMRSSADESFVGILPKASLRLVLDQSNKSLGSSAWACFDCWLMCNGFVPLPPMVFCGSKEKRVYIPFGLKKTLQLTSHERERCFSIMMGSPHYFSVTSLKIMSYLLKKLCCMLTSTYSVSRRGSSFSESFPECPYNFLTNMSSCVVSTPSEEAIGLVSTISGGRSCFITSPCNVTIDYSLAVKAFSTHLNLVSTSLSVFSEDEFALCVLLSLCLIVLLQRGCLIPSPTCNRAV